MVALVSGASAANVEDFHQTWAQAKQAAVSEGKLIYLHFTTDWCSWCRKIEKETYPAKAASRALRDFVPASLDCTVEEGQPPRGQVKVNRDLFRKFGGSGYPFLVMTTPEGALLKTVGGYVDPKRFVEALDQAKAVHRELQDFQARPVKATYEYALAAMRIHAKVRLWDRAKIAAEKVRALDRENDRDQAAEASWVLVEAASAEVPTDAASARARQAKIAALEKDVKWFDPKNEKGFLRRVLLREFRRNLQAATESKDIAATRKSLDRAQAVLVRLTSVAEKVPAAQMMWVYLGELNRSAGRRDKALAAFQQALEIDPASRVAGRIKKSIQKLEGAE